MRLFAAVLAAALALPAAAAEGAPAGRTPFTAELLWKVKRLGL